MWPIVTFSPTTVGRSSAQWMTQLSCTLEPAPITIALLSPRRTAPNQMLAPGDDGDVADQDRGRRDERVVRDLRRLAVELDHRRHRASSTARLCSSVPISRLCASPSATIPLSRSTLAASHSSRFAAA